MSGINQIARNPVARHKILAGSEHRIESAKSHKEKVLIPSLISGGGWCPMFGGGWRLMLGGGWCQMFGKANIMAISKFGLPVKGRFCALVKRSDPDP